MKRLHPESELNTGCTWQLLMRNQNNDYQYNLDYLEKYHLERDEQALEWLIFNNSNLVHKIVGRYKKIYHHKLDYDDLFSVGLEGLIKAIEKFDFNFKNNFSTYATYWIKQGIMRAIADEGFTIRIPVHLFETLNQVMKYEQSIKQHDELLDVDHLCDKLELPFEKYEIIKRVQTMMLKPTSLNGFVSKEEEDTEIQDLVTINHSLIAEELPPDSDNPEKKILDKELKAHMEKMILHLNSREQFVITHRFGLDGVNRKTLEEIGAIEGVTRERIRQIESRAMKKLRKLMSGYKDHFQRG